MAKTRADYPLVIIGAGAAGLGASEQAAASGTGHVVLEASHRIGGRGLTEFLEGGIAVDLGCHWLHSGSINPYAKWADKLGFEYKNQRDSYRYAMHFGGHWLGADKRREYGVFMHSCHKKIDQLYQESPANPVFAAVDDNSDWAQHFCYWMSLMHSADADQVAVQDVVEYRDTSEDWPLKNGYGALICKQGERCPVQLNTQVQAIRWNSNPVRITTNKGETTADKVIITVSTGVLAARQIDFFPTLPLRKLEAIHALPLGNSNYQFFSIDQETFDQDVPENVHFQQDDISMAIRIRPFNTRCLFTSTGGRFAWWLEKQGLGASKAYLIDGLVKIFGGEIRGKLREFRLSAWGYDPWIRGAYSAQTPGCSGMRRQLAEPVDECLYFAGEATSTDFFSTAHGAYLSGIRAVKEVVATVKSVD